MPLPYVPRANAYKLAPGLELDHRRLAPNCPGNYSYDS